MKLDVGNYEFEIVYHDPLVFTLKGVLSEGECNHFIKTASNNVKRSSEVDMTKAMKERMSWTIEERVVTVG